MKMTGTPFIVTSRSTKVAASAAAIPTNPSSLSYQRARLSVIHQTILLSMLFSVGRGSGAGVCWAIVTPMLVSSILSYVLIARLLEIRLGRLVGPVARGMSAGVVMLLAVEWLQRSIAGYDWTAATSLAASVAAGAITYLAATLVLNRSALLDALKTLRDVLRAAPSPN